MNTSIFDFSESTQKLLSRSQADGKPAHAIIIEGKGKQVENAVTLLTMYAVCSSEEKPCGKCPNCRKAKNRTHPDVLYLGLEDKAKLYKLNRLRELIKDTVIAPNEADSKVYVLEHADMRMEAVQQNALLKIIEEPPENVYFIFTCESARSLLVTIRSRCTLLKLSGKDSGDGKAWENAREIIRGILSVKEYDLLKATFLLTDKSRAEETLGNTALILRDGLAYSAGGKPEHDGELGKKLALKFTKDKLIKMIELTEKHRNLISGNININLLSADLCAEYRRISWQR